MVQMSTPRQQDLGAMRPSAHVEPVLEVPTSEVGATAAIVKQAMETAGMPDIVIVEAKAGPMRLERGVGGLGYSRVCFRLSTEWLVGVQRSAASARCDAAFPSALCARTDTMFRALDGETE
jgi:hypothetical protein